MASRTSWTAGNGVGYTWSSFITGTSTNFTTMANGSTMLSTVADIANQTNQDQFMDISYAFSIASSTIAAGANIAFWLYYLNQDGSHYGDNQLTAGTAAAVTPSFAPCATLGIPAVAATTAIYGTVTGIVIAPGSFRGACQNNCGFTFTAATVQYRTYNQNLNA
jgi:hypothetical protein